MIEGLPHEGPGTTERVYGPSWAAELRAGKLGAGGPAAGSKPAAPNGGNLQQRRELA
jgi:hypothetical protein